MNSVGGRLPALVFASYTKVNDNGPTTSANQSNMAALLPPCAIFTYEKNIDNLFLVICLSLFTVWMIRLKQDKTCMSVNVSCHSVSHYRIYIHLFISYHTISYKTYHIISNSWRQTKLVLYTHRTVLSRACVVRILIFGNFRLLAWKKS